MFKKTCSDFLWMLFLNMFKNGGTLKKGQISKEEIFEKAVKLFSSKGIDNVTMRDLATYCDMSPGAFYYHFKNKEDLILHFYQVSLEGHLARGEEYLTNAPKNLTAVMTWICQDRFTELYEYKSMLRPLVFKFDSSSPLSPWAKESYEFRRLSVEFFIKAAAHSLNVKNKQILEVLGRGLWIHHLVIVGFWTVSKKTDNQGEILLNESKKLWKWLPTFLKIPGSKSVLKKISFSLKKIGFWEEYET